MREREGQIKYVCELFGSIVIYCIILAVAVWIARTMPMGHWRTLVLLSPMLGFLLTIWAVARQFHRGDEYIRRTTLETIAITFAITAGLTFTYGFLEAAGCPRLSMFTVWPMMSIIWIVLGITRKLLER